MCDAISLVMSDVVGDDLSVIASGSTYRDKTTFNDVEDIFKKYSLTKFLPKRVLKRIDLGKKRQIPETPKVSKIVNYIVGTNRDCLDAMCQESKTFGLCTKTVYCVSGEVGNAVKKLLELFPKKSKSCLIFGGETTVTLTGKGKGGRSMELVLQILKETIGQNMTIASIGTDGIDGNTDAAGAIASSNNSFNDIDSFLQNNDSYSFFKKYGGLIYTGSTHTNLIDIGILLKL